MLCNSVLAHGEGSLKVHWDAIFKKISYILAASDNKLKHKHSQSASSHGSEATEEEEAAPKYVLVSDDDE